MSDRCGIDTVEWSTLGHEVTGNICVFDDAITLDFFGEGSVAFPFSEGDLAFRLDPSLDGNPFGGMISEAESITRGVPGVSIPSRNDFLPRELDDKLRLEVISSGSAGPPFSYEASMTGEIPFDRPRIPMHGGFRETILAELPNSVNLTIDVEPGNYFDYLFFGEKTLEIDIPTEAFFEFVDPPGCDVQHSELFSAGEDLADDGQSFASRVESLSTQSTTGGSSSDIESAIEERISQFDGRRSLQDLFDRDDRTISDLRDGSITDFNSVDDATDELESFRSDLQNLTEELNDIERRLSPDSLRESLAVVESRRGDVGSFCGGEWGQIAERFDVSGVRSAFDRFEQVRRQLDRLQFMVDGVPGEISEPEDEPARDAVDEARDTVEETVEQLEEIPQEIRERARDLIDRIEEKVDTPFMERDPEELQRLRDEVEDLISEVEGLERGRPGRSEVLGDLRGASGRVNRINAARSDALPCQSRYPDAHELVQDFEDSVEQLTTDVTEGELESLEDIEEAAVSVVENIDDQSCREHFTRRMKRGNRRVDTRVSPIRVAQEFIDQNRERRNSLLEGLGISFSRDQLEL